MSPSVADILREAGFVPVVPELSRKAGIPGTLTPQRVPAVPVVPVVPVEKYNGEAATAKSGLVAALPDTAAPDHQRDRLRAAAKAEGLPTDEIDRLAPEDVEGVELWTDTQLRRVVHWYHRDPPRLWRSGAA